MKIENEFIKEDLEFDGNYNFSKTGIEGCLFINSKREKTNGNHGYFYYFPYTNEIEIYFDENSVSNTELSEIENALLIEQIYSAYFKRTKRDLKDTWYGYLETLERMKIS